VPIRTALGGVLAVEREGEPLPPARRPRFVAPVDAGRTVRGVRELRFLRLGPGEEPRDYEELGYRRRRSGPDPFRRRTDYEPPADDDAPLRAASAPAMTSPMSAEAGVPSTRPRRDEYTPENHACRSHGIRLLPSLAAD